MTPDKVEEIVEEFQSKDYIVTADGGLYVAVDAHWLRTTLTQYHQDMISEVVGIVKNSRTVDELHGVGLLEEQTRTQVIADIIKSK